MSALEGIRVVEMAGLAPAPFCGMILADFGAEVVRVDRIGAGSMDQLARGKRSVAVNLKSPEGVETVLRLTEHADVLLEPYRPGVMERLGLGPDVACARNPAPGLRPPHRLRAGWAVRRAWPDTTSTTSPSRARCRCSAARARSHCRPSTCSATSRAAACCARSASASRCSSVRTRDEGQVVDAAMVDGAAYLATFVYKFRNAGMWRDERGTNMLDSGAPFYDTYRTKDGEYMSVGAIEPQFYAALLKGLGLDAATHAAASWTRRRGRRPGHASPRSSRPRRATSGAPSSTGPTPASRPSSLWARRTSIRTTARVSCSSPIARASASPRRRRACRVRPATASRPLPRVGEHTRTVLAEYGLSGDDIERLARDGAIG